MQVDSQEAIRGSVEEHHARGYMLRKRGDFHGAILHYSKGLEIQPDHFSALFNRGFSYDKVSSHTCCASHWTVLLWDTAVSAACTVHVI